MDNQTHVYCTECEFGKNLINSLMYDNTDSIPKSCTECYPWNPEDSFIFEIRHNYIPLNQQQP